MNTAVWPFLFIAALAGGACSSFTDEGVSLGRKIEKAGEALRHSIDTLTVVKYEPAEGANQRYSVDIAQSDWCRVVPCEKNGYLTVEVEHGNHGSTTVHLNAVAVPKSLTIQKHGQPTEVVLRKTGDTVQVVQLR